jgi:hypothetical protein
MSPSLPFAQFASKLLFRFPVPDFQIHDVCHLPAMADDTNPKRTSRGLGFPVAIVFLVLLLYVLSPPPVEKYLCQGGKHQAAFETFYTPLIWATLRVPGVHEFYDWYFKVWGIGS